MSLTAGTSMEGVSLSMYIMGLLDEDIIMLGLGLLIIIGEGLMELIIMGLPDMPIIIGLICRSLRAPVVGSACAE